MSAEPIVTSAELPVHVLGTERQFRGTERHVRGTERHFRGTERHLRRPETSRCAIRLYLARPQ